MSKPLPFKPAMSITALPDIFVITEAVFPPPPAATAPAMPENHVPVVRLIAETVLLLNLLLLLVLLIPVPLPGMLLAPRERQQEIVCQEGWFAPHMPPMPAIMAGKITVILLPLIVTSPVMDLPVETEDVMQVKARLAQ